MKTTYRVMVNGSERLNFSADFDQAASPILMDGDGTPFQVADARHNPVEAAEILNGYCHSEGGEAFGDDETWTLEEVDSDS